MASFLATNDFNSEVKGLKNLQAEALQKYGPGDYIPPVAATFWSFRFMVGIGMLMILLSALAVYWSQKGQLDKKAWFLKLLLPAAFLPYLATSFGWIMTEVGRSPWIVYGLQKIEDALSPNVPAWNVLFSMVVLGLLYTVLTIIAASLMLKYGKGDPDLAHDDAAAAAVK